MIPRKIRIARNITCYGECRSIVAYRGNDEVGRAVFGVYPVLNWTVGPSGRDDFDVMIPVNPALTGAEVLAEVETTLRRQIRRAA